MGKGDFSHCDGPVDSEGECLPVLVSLVGKEDCLHCNASGPAVDEHLEMALGGNLRLGEI